MCLNVIAGVNTMAKNKFYAVRKGLTPGIYTSWDDCKANVNGFPGAEYKGFSSLNDARMFVGFDCEVFNHEDITISKPKPTIEPLDLKGMITAYVDGSYNTSNKKAGWGCVILNKTTETFSGSMDDIWGSRNVTGEVAAAKRAMRYALDNGFKKLKIYYDYQGIECWATGEWKAKKGVSLEYQAFIENARASGLELEFHKVMAHTGDRYNEWADRLANQAAGI